MRSAPLVVQRDAVRDVVPRGRSRRLQPEAVVVLVDGVDVGRRLAVDRLGGDRPLRHLPVRRGRAVRRRAVPDAARARGRRALQGKSSGGYGAIVTALARPDLFGAVAAHAPDALFEVTIARGFAPAARALRDRHDGSARALLGDVHHAAELRRRAARRAALVGARLLRRRAAVRRSTTASIVPEVWARWLERDPVRLVAEQQEAAARARAASGSTRATPTSTSSTSARRRSAARFAEAGIPEERVHFELYEGRHGGASRRYPLSLAWLVRGLSSSL